MEDHESKLSHKQEKGLAALLAEPTLAAAARAAQVDEKTLRNWLKQPFFRQAYRAGCDQILDHTVTKLQVASSLAVDTLRAKLQSKSESVAVRAASELLAAALKATDQREILEGLRAVENKLRDGSNTGIPEAD
jgi:hypothetical protein